jgi:hypothetical protein
VAIHIDTLYLICVLALWVALFQAACWLVALAHRHTLVCWSVGPLGVSAVYLREPPPLLVLAQMVVPALVIGSASYVSLYVVRPGPIAGLDPRPLVRLGTAIAVGAATVAIQALRLLGDRRFPIWGEARVLACVQRSVALGSIVHFTPSGRAFLRERFGATPAEFLRNVS